MQKNHKMASGSVSLPALPVRNSISTSLDTLHHRLSILDDHIATLEELLIPVTNLKDDCSEDSDCKEVSDVKSMVRNQIDLGIDHVKVLEHRICNIIDHLDI